MATAGGVHNTVQNVPSNHRHCRFEEDDFEDEETETKSKKTSPTPPVHKIRCPGSTWPGLVHRPLSVSQ